MSTPRDPHGGDTDWGRPPAGGWGAAGDPESDPHADPPTPPYGTPAAGNGDWAREPAPAAEPHDDTVTPVHGWDPAERTIPASDERTFGAAAQGGDAGWSAQADGQTGGWDPTGRSMAGGTESGSTGGWSTGGHGDADPAGAAGGAGSEETTAFASAGSATTAATRGRRSGSGGRRGLLLGGGIALVVIVAAVLVLGFWKPGFFLVDELDQAALQTGVTQILTQDYGLGATDVTCPEGQRVTPGATFACSATVDGENVQVPVTVLDEQGTYQVGRV